LEIRQRIISSCRELAHSKGFRSITVDEIAQHAGVSKRTVYRRFKTKDEILSATVDDFLQDIGRESEQLLNSGQDIRIIIQDILYYIISGKKSIINQRVMEDLAQYYPQLWQKINQFRMDRIRSMIAIAESQHAFNSEINPLILSTMILVSIQTVINPDFIIKNNLNFEEAAAQVIAVFMPALSSAPPLPDIKAKPC